MNAALTQKLRQDLQAVVTDAEDLLKATASHTGERAEQIRARAEVSLNAARARLAEAGALLDQKARAAAGSVDGQVHAHPYAVAGIAAGIGVLLGLLLIGRR
jgi:ElaB/YqjD/DUF883 family membrane-anchored ribosome-binding protein